MNVLLKQSSYTIKSMTDNVLFQSAFSVRGTNKRFVNSCISYDPVMKTFRGPDSVEHGSQLKHATLYRLVVLRNSSLTGRLVLLFARKPSRTIISTLHYLQ